MTETISTFAVEGVPFAGKTTTLQNTQKNHPGRIHVVPEISEYIGGHQNNPKFPFDSFGEAKESVHFVTAVERRRSSDAIKAYETTGLSIVYDRATPFFSLFLFEFLGKQDKDKAKLYTDVSNYALDVFQEEANRNKILVPANIIYMKPGSQDTFANRISRGASNNMFTQWENVEYFDGKYTDLMTTHYGEGHSLTLESDNTQSSLDQNSITIVNFVDEMNQSEPPTNIFATFLGANRIHTTDTEEDEFQTVYLKYGKLMDDADLGAAGFNN